MTLSTEQFEFVCRMVDEQAGVALEPDQQVFVAGRLLKVAQRRGWNRVDLLIDGLKKQRDRTLVQEVIESLVTHETSFFRDPHYFEELTANVLPRLMTLRIAERQLTIWCAACSTGQEVYSVAMILRELFAEKLRDWNVKLIASDLSSAALQQAESGRYSDVEVRRGLSEARLAQHFRHEQTSWRIDDRLRQMIQFHQCNLIGTWPPMPCADLVLLRNALIYMSPITRQSILNRMQKAIRPDGYVMLGNSESANVTNLQIVRA